MKRLLAKGQKSPYSVEVNLEEQTVTGEDGKVYTFTI